MHLLSPPSFSFNFVHTRVYSFEYSIQQCLFPVAGLPVRIFLRMPFEITARNIWATRSIG